MAQRRCKIAKPMVYAARILEYIHNVHHLRLLPLALCTLILAACTLQQPGNSSQPQVIAEDPAKRTEQIPQEVLAQPLSGTGALAERLLPTGVLEIGNRNAPLSLLLFTEHHCRYCKEFWHDQFPKIAQGYIAKGNLRLSVVITPLKKYESSQEDALALICAAMEGRGQAMHDALFDRDDKTPITSIAEAVGLPAGSFSACMKDESTTLILGQQQAWAHSLSVSLVPTFFLNGTKVTGLPYAADLRGMIENELADR
ncbi:MAG: thioredoxin domain-containing protein [Candidatus Peribacteraceae bacterium]|nr:thioredoxin domain-containing protein [Candidatus Peribacteraceae bacterium]